MKRCKHILCAVLALCLILVSPVLTFAATPTADKDFQQAVADLAEKYGVKISVKSMQRSETVEDQAAQLAGLEARLIAGQKALRENNRQAEENWQKLVTSGRLDENATITPNAVASPYATHTVYYYQQIGYVYPDMTTIECYITGNVVYSDFYQRNLWGSVVSTGSSLFAGPGDEWEETDSQVDLIDGGRTYYVQVWGDLTETYTIGLNEYEVTSEGWRIWYEAYCPA
ncbi:MAG: hypothetical protein PWR31_1341 [Bacillota bacterium]|nr:hypothetical protein [Bacillota bacterium]